MDSRRLRRWAPAIVAAFFLFSASVVQGTGGESLVGPFGLLGIDKWLHGVGYGVLAFLVAAARGRSAWRALVVAVVFVVVFGGFVEAVQGFLPWRSASAFDLLADAVGAVVGAAAYRGWRALGTRHDERGPPPV